MRKTNKRSRRGSLRLCLLALVCAAPYCFWTCSSARQPGAALADAMRALERGNFSSAEALLADAAKDERIGTWVALVRGELLEKQQQPAEALAAYRSIPLSSAASLDARLAILRLQPAPDAGSAEAHQSGAMLSELEVDLRKARRHDLIPPFSYLKAKAVEREGAAVSAYAAYKQIRQEWPGHESAAAARSAMEELRGKNGAVAGISSVAEQLAEASLLFNEGDLPAALDTVQNVKTQVAENTPAHFQAMLLEEQIVRRMNRPLEADHLLALISADGGAGTADEALYKIIRNAWNANEHRRALDFIENFRRRFPSSPLANTVLYMKARILEEDSQLAEAKAVYQEMADHAKEGEEKLKAARQLAWIHLRKSDYLHAAEAFQQAVALAGQLLAQPQFAQQQKTEASIQRPDAKTALSPRELLEERLHAAFFFAYCASRLDNQAGPLRNTPVKTAADAVRLIFAEQPFGYYALAAREHLPELAAAVQPALPGSHNADAECIIAAPGQLVERLGVLHASDLRDFSQHEVDWFIAQETGAAAARVIKGLSRAQLSQLYARIEKSVAITNDLLFSPPADAEEKAAIERCRELIIALSYPLPYRELFDRSATENGISVSLAYAIARTESYFDTAAKSPKEALGLMQLLKKTAEVEGLQEGEDLLLAEVNVKLGTKHLARLLKQHGSIPYAAAAYNAGTSAAERWKSRYGSLEPLLWIELIGYPETKNYVKKVLQAEQMYRQRLAAS